MPTGNFVGLQFEEEDKDAEKEQAEEEAHKMHWWDFWRHEVFWTRHSPIYLTIICFIVGVSFFIWQRGAVVAYFEVGPQMLYRPCVDDMQSAPVLKHLLLHFVTLSQ